MQTKNYFTRRFRPLAAALMLSMSACGGGGGSTSPQSSNPPPTTNAERIAALEASGALPRLDRSADVKGPDVNSNGIRDDVEAFIASKYPDAMQRAAAIQFAASLQASLLVDKADSAAVKALSVRGSRAVNCIFSRFDGASGSKYPAAVVEEVTGVTTNTKPRLLAHLAFSKALDGTVLTLPEGNTCD